MSFQAFAQAVEALSSPLSSAATRHEADAWLTAFKRSPEAWEVCQQQLQVPAALDAALTAAQILAFKAKKQLAQLEEARQAALVEALAAQLAATGSGGVAAAAPVRRALCVALANLAIHCEGWARPLETLGKSLRHALLSAQLCDVSVLAGWVHGRGYGLRWLAPGPECINRELPRALLPTRLRLRLHLHLQGPAWPRARWWSS